MMKMGKRQRQVYPFLISVTTVYFLLIVFNQQSNVRQSGRRFPWSSLQHPEVIIHSEATKHDIEVAKVNAETSSTSTPLPTILTDVVEQIPTEPPIDSWDDDAFEKLEGLDMYVRNAYFDRREDNRVKVIKAWMLSPRKLETVFCHVRWVEEYGHTKETSVQAILRMQDESVRPFCKYITGVIECPWNHPFIPKYVSFSRSAGNRTNAWHIAKIINPPTKTTGKVGICLKTLFDQNENNLGPMIEWFELNKLLGIDKVIMYNYDNLGAKVVKLMDHYEQMGFVKMKTWTLPLKTYTKNIYRVPLRDPVLRAEVKKTTNADSDVPCVRYHAQHLTYMDCIYENMHQYSYLVFIDVDEYIMPEQNKTLKELLHHLGSQPDQEKAASFVFQEACFQSTLLPFSNNQINIGVLTPNYQRGPYMPEHSHKAMKSAIRPQLVKNMHIHRVSGKEPSLWGYKPLVYVDKRFGKLHHYKNSGRCEPYNNTDKATFRFQNKLTKNIESTYSLLFHTK